MNYYKVLGLERERLVTISGKLVSVHLPRPEVADVYTNDLELSERTGRMYTWISGGGSYIISNRYLLAVERDKLTNVNPGLISLFTGRSDSQSEWLNPRLLVRELLEELTVYKRHKPLQFKVDFCGFLSCEDPTVNIRERKDFYDKLDVYDGKTKNSIDGILLIDSKRDINFIRLFELDLDLHDLSFCDSESPNIKRKIKIIDLNELKISNADTPLKWSTLDWINCGYNLRNIIGIYKGDEIDTYC